MRRLGPATQPGSAVQVQEDGDTLIPFAKCSRVISRSTSPSLPPQHLGLMPQRYRDIFWENLSQRPSPTWTEEQYAPPLLRVPACSQPGLNPPEGLPPPEVLCRRKRRRPQVAGMQQGPGCIPARVRAVAYHLEDLRRRQRLINEEKKAQWGGSGAACEPLALAEGSNRVPGTSKYQDLEEERAAYPQEEGHPLTTGRPQVWRRDLVGCGVGGAELAWRDRGSLEPGWGAGLVRDKTGRGAGKPGATASPVLLILTAWSGHPGAPGARAGLASRGGWALWPPAPLSQPAGSPCATPGGRQCSLRSEDAPDASAAPRPAPWLGAPP
uniref:Inhibitor of CDK, cyclin A1 interacting protein 1 n=1 Tax=Canis lupus familiaris TaxID=9615 RepID=A0A8C0RQL7_CANLF